MKKLLATFTRRASDKRSEIYEVLGLAAICFGISLLAVPAGIIATGVALCFLGFTVGGDE